MARNKKRFFKNISDELMRLNPKKSHRKKKNKHAIKHYTPEDWDDLMDQVYFND